MFGRAGGVDVDELFGMRHRQGPQQDRIHRGENRGVDSNPDGQGSDRHQREGRAGDQVAQRVAKILQHIDTLLSLGDEISPRAVARGPWLEERMVAPEVQRPQLMSPNQRFVTPRFGLRTLDE